MHDPLVDPMACCVVRTQDQNILRAVAYVDQSGVDYDLWTHGGAVVSEVQRHCSLSTWRRWCKENKAEVVG